MPAAHAQTADEIAIKAVFLFRFGAFVDWPSAAFASPDSPLAICVTGSDKLAQDVRRAAAGQTINGRPVAVSTDPDATGCHILYADADSSEAVSAILARVGDRPVLTVTDERNSASRGDIHFVIADNRVRFHIDRAEAERKGLRLSSRLLDIALSAGPSNTGGRQ
jgi:hypothetical protein